MWFRKRRENPWLGAGAGLIGGLAGSFAIGGFQHLWAKKTNSTMEQRGMEATVKAADAVTQRVTGHELDEQTKPKAATAVHFLFGSLMGAAYGAATAANRKVGTAAGLPFGAAVYAGAHATAVPALRLSEPPTRVPAKDEIGELLGHLVYGFVTDATRRVVIKAARAM